MVGLLHVTIVLGKPGVVRSLPYSGGSATKVAMRLPKFLYAAQRTLKDAKASHAGGKCKCWVSTSAAILESKAAR